MPVPPIKPTAIAVYVYRKVAGGNLEFLQIRRSKTAASHHQSFQTVYGGIEPGETAIEAAKRYVATLIATAMPVGAGALTPDHFASIREHDGAAR